MIENTFIIPILHDVYIDTMLESLKQYAGHNYQVIIIDQTTSDRVDYERANVTIVPSRNLGFAKAMNTGIRMANTPYITYANDDIVFLDSRWWQGIKDTFEKNDKIIAVNPLSPKEPGWGYGNTTPDWGIRLNDFIYPNSPIKMYHPESVDYDWLVEKYKKGWIDGIAGWCVTLRKDLMNEFLDKEQEEGLNPDRLWFDERFYPGGGEDYDVCHRLYGKGYRAVATCSSYVWHHWGKSTEHVIENPAKIDNSLRWNKLNELYKETENGWKSPIFQKPMSRVLPVESVPFDI